MSTSSPNVRSRARLAPFLFFSLAAGATASPADAHEAAASGGASAFEAAQARVAAGRDPIPGPRNCLFRYGPISGDPYINIAFPDAGTFFWGAAFSVPPGARLELEGAYFPRGRYTTTSAFETARPCLIEKR